MSCSRRRWRSPWSSSTGRRARRSTSPCCEEDPFGLKSKFVGLKNFRDVLSRAELPQRGRGHGDLQPVDGDPRHGAGAAAGDGRREGGPRQGLLPHAADLALCGGARPSPACCGCSCSIPPWAPSPTCCATSGIAWDPLLNGDQAMLLVVVAAAWKQISYNFLFFVAGAAVDPAIADRGGGDRRRRLDQAVLDDRLPADRADHLLPAGRQHRLCLLRHLRHHRCRHRRRAGAGDRDAGLQGLPGRLRQSRPRRIGGAVGHPDGDRDRAHRHPVPLRGTAGALWLTPRDRPMIERSTFGRPIAHVLLILGIADRRLPDLLHLRRLDAVAADDPAAAAAAFAGRPGPSRTTARRCSAASAGSAASRSGRCCSTRR